jgi:hypothetical protein
MSKQRIGSPLTWSLLCQLWRAATLKTRTVSALDMWIVGDSWPGSRAGGKMSAMEAIRAAVADKS